VRSIAKPIVSNARAGISPISKSRRGAADHHVAAVAGPDAASQFAAFGDGKVGGGVDGTRVGPVAIEESVVGIAPPDGYRDGVEHFTQALSLPSRSVGDRRARSIDEPKNVLTAGGPPALD